LFLRDQHTQVACLNQTKLPSRRERTEGRTSQTERGSAHGKSAPVGARLHCCACAARRSGVDDNKGKPVRTRTALLCWGPSLLQTQLSGMRRRKEGTWDLSDLPLPNPRMGYTKMADCSLRARSEANRRQEEVRTRNTGIT